MKKHAYLVALSLIAPNVGAQSADPEIITITGSRLNLAVNQVAASVNVLTREDIELSGALQITDLLRGLPGVTIAQSGSFGALTEIRVRGSESNHVLILIDGVVANDEGQGGLVDFAHLTAANIERIEFSRGPQSALWGSGAVGGVISITTKTAENDKELSLALMAGTQNTNQMAFSGGINTDHLKLSGYFESTDTQGENVARTGEEKDGYENLTMGVKLDWQINTAHSINLSLRHTDYENEFDDIDFVATGLPIDANNLTEGTQQQVSILWRYDPKNTEYASSLLMSAREDENQGFNSGFDVGGTTGQRLQMTWLNYFSLGKNWQMVVGGDWLQRLFEQRGTATSFGDPNQEQHDTTLAGLLELNGSHTDNWSTNFSVRFDSNSEFDDATSWRLGTNYQISRGLRYFASVGESVKTPTFTERFGFFPGNFIGNSALIPETSFDVEMGLQWTASTNLDVTVSVFDNELENEILGFVFDSDNNGFTAGNADAKSDRAGVEVSVTQQLDEYRINWHYSYLDASESNVNELRRANHQGSITVQSDWQNSDWSAYIKLAYTGTREDLFFPPGAFVGERVTLDAYSYVSANAQYQMTKEWRWNMRVENAFDETYEDVLGFVGNPLSVQLSLQYQPSL